MLGKDHIQYVLEILVLGMRPFSELLNLDLATALLLEELIDEALIDEDWWSAGELAR